MEQNLSKIAIAALVFSITLMIIGLAVEITPTPNAIGYALCLVGAMYGFVGMIVAVKETF